MKINAEKDNLEGAKEMHLFTKLQTDLRPWGV